MRYHRFWIEIVLLGSVAALALALLFATLGAAAGAAENARDSSQLNPSRTTFEGMVTCSRCGARHSATLDRSASTCVRVCVHGGASFALVNADATYLLEGDLTVLKKLAGQRARVIGIRDGQTIKVVSMASEI
jgi:hypothetical protein